MNTIKRRMTLLALTLPLALVALDTQATMPPEYVELTPLEMQRLGFEYKVSKENNLSFIELRYPAQIAESRVPHSTSTVVRDLSGALVAESTQWLGDEQVLRIVESRYDHEKVDVSISVTFSRGSNLARVFRILSVSGFIKANAASSAKH